jgi:hypothetical protein
MILICPCTPSASVSAFAPIVAADDAMCVTELVTLTAAVEPAAASASGVPFTAT